MPKMQGFATAALWAAVAATSATGRWHDQSSCPSLVQASVRTSRLVPAEVGQVAACSDGGDDGHHCSRPEGEDLGEPVFSASLLQGETERTKVVDFLEVDAEAEASGPPNGPNVAFAQTASQAASTANAFVSAKLPENKSKVPSGTKLTLAHAAAQAASTANATVGAKLLQNAAKAASKASAIVSAKPPENLTKAAPTGTDFVELGVRVTKAPKARGKSPGRRSLDLGGRGGQAERLAKQSDRTATSEKVTAGRSVAATAGGPLDTLASYVAAYVASLFSGNAGNGSRPLPDPLVAPADETDLDLETAASVPAGLTLLTRAARRTWMDATSHPTSLHWVTFAIFVLILLFGIVVYSVLHLVKGDLRDAFEDGSSDPAPGPPLANTYRRMTGEPPSLKTGLASPKAPPSWPGTPGGQEALGSAPPGSTPALWKKVGGPSQDPGPSLCPELLVPKSSECTLNVPWNPMALFSSTAGHAQVVTIDDARGVPVFRVTVGPPAEGSPGNLGVAKIGGDVGPGRHLVLFSATCEAVFAFCREGATPGTLALHHHTGTSFGDLRAAGDADLPGDTDEFIITNARGQRIVNFRRNKGPGSLKATDEMGRLLAIAEPEGKAGSGYRSVRIGPLVDAGLIILALLAIDMLKGSDKHKI